jgi:hypothetical protein
MTGPRGGPAEGLLGEADGVLQVEAAHVGAPQHRDIRGAGSLPPQPQHLGWAGVGRHALDLDADQGAAHDRAQLLGSSGGVQLLLGMQPGPGLYVHAIILVVVFDVPAARRRPGAWVASVELGAMTAWPATLDRAWLRWRVG